jgi:hypothetical protein
VLLAGSIFPNQDNTVKDGSVILGFLLFSSYGIVIGYICELTLGLAAWKIFRYFGVRSIYAYAIGGALLGWLFFAVTILAFSRFVSGSPSVFLNPYFWIDGASGMVSAILFRFVVFSGEGSNTA